MKKYFTILLFVLPCAAEAQAKDTVIDGKTFTFHYLVKWSNDSIRYCDNFKGRKGERIYLSKSAKITSRGQLKYSRVTRESRRYYSTDKYQVPKKVLHECGTWTTYNEDGTRVTIKIKCRRVTIARS